MKKQIIFLLTFALSTYSCFSMELEKEDKIITLDKGLLTVIPAKVTQRGCEEGIFFGIKYFEEISEKNDTLINLWSGKAKPEKPYDTILFCPFIIKLITQQPHSSIYKLGNLNRKKHCEAEEAVRERQALYCTRGKNGYLVYSITEQPSPSICEHVNRMLEDNKTEMIIPQ